MKNIFARALLKITSILDIEGINYMIVGGFAVSFHNRARTTNDIDLVLQIYPHHVDLILKHFPNWQEYRDSFKSSVKSGLLFNITDFETGVRYDFMTYQDSEYNWTAFERREKVDFFTTTCYICSKEDLVISKLKWYNISQSDKQYEDLKFLLLDKGLNLDYIKNWTVKLNLKPMEFWNNKVGVSKQAASMQISIINKFSSEKRMKIALDISNFGVDQTRNWIKTNNPSFSELEITLEFVRLIYFEKGDMSTNDWTFYKNEMEVKIRKNWSERFRKMMVQNNWDYNDVAKLGGFKNGKVIEATISRSLPSFAKLSVVMHELRIKNQTDNKRD